MKLPLLATASLLAVCASYSFATASPITSVDFTYTGGFQSFTAATAGTYDILAYGAQGGAGQDIGGLGAEAGGDISLAAGEILSIAVGGGGSNGGGGGGLTGTAGGQGFGSVGINGGVGGTGGSGGAVGGAFAAAGGGGFRSAGSGNAYAAGGGSFPGGLGGGGGGSNNGGGPGGGGGSFDGGFNQMLLAGANAGNGSVMITDLTPPVTPVPEPGSLLVLGTGLLGLGLLKRRAR